jgi:membrane protease YdiL (CAAX protease family)
MPPARHRAGLPSGPESTDDSLTRVANGSPFSVELAMLEHRGTFQLLLFQLAATQDRLRRLGSYDMLPQTPREFAIYPIAAVAGSTCEELLYRGFLIGTLTPLMGTAGAVLVSSASFGLGHAYQGRLRANPRHCSLVRDGR